ncbi:MAG: hypothetical protein CSA68_06410 [Rhodobacterales bacterium]|nr:MAG: hypothetical protein CSA68_06410 [Rhodobacterales bacterium]
MGLLVTLLYRARALRPYLGFKGLKVPVTGAHVTRPVWKHLWKGDYEAPEILALQNLVRDGDVILEMGSGMGVVSAVASRLAENVHIEAYEANPTLIERIKDLHQINKIDNITVHNAILLPTSDETSRHLNLHENFTESSIVEGINSQSSVEVPVKDFRQVLQDVKPTVFMCDIEGGEEELFQGIDLSGIRAVILELHPKVISRAAIKAIYDTCARAGLYPRIEWSTEQVVAFERVEG